MLTGAPLPSGWTGKLWALSQGVALKGGRGVGKGANEEGARARAAVRPHAPAVAFDDARDRGEADARPLVLGRGVQARERLEQLRREAGVEPGAAKTSTIRPNATTPAGSSTE